VLRLPQHPILESFCLLLGWGAVPAPGGVYPFPAECQGPACGTYLRVIGTEAVEWKSCWCLSGSSMPAALLVIS
jgi:hypothetical protein